MWSCLIKAGQLYKRKHTTQYNIPTYRVSNKMYLPKLVTNIHNYLIVVKSSLYGNQIFVHITS